jgi:outer membrane receptor protein involved in Fe transport
MYNPRQQFSGRSLLQLRAVELDTTVFHNGPLEAGGVSGYTTADVRAGWRASHSLRLDFSVTNVFDRRHVEATRYLYEVPTELGREVFARFTFGL